MIVLIPLGGIGERFKKLEYIKPKALIEVCGKCIIFHLLDNLNLEKIEYVLIPYNKEYINFNLEELVYVHPTYLLEWKQLFIDNREKTKQHIIASSIIIENSIVRQVINLFFRTYDPIRPTRIVKNIEEGKKFINENSN